MADNASDYLEEQIFNHLLRNDTFSKPQNICIGLTLDVPTDDGTYTEVADANNYSRYVGASGDSAWNTYDTGTNAEEFAFDAATGDWGTVSGVIITDSATHSAGNVLLHGELTTPKQVQNGDLFRFGISDLSLTIS